MQYIGLQIRWGKSIIYSVCDAVMLMMIMKTITSAGLDFSIFKVATLILH